MNGYFGIKRKEMEGDRDDLLEEREETLPQTGLHLKNATMLTTERWKAKHQHPLDKFEWITGNGSFPGEL